jgi:hypothetical protein
MLNNYAIYLLISTFHRNLTDNLIINALCRMRNLAIYNLLIFKDKNDI